MGKIKYFLWKNNVLVRSLSDINDSKFSKSISQVDYPYEIYRVVLIKDLVKSKFILAYRFKSNAVLFLKWLKRSIVLQVARIN